MLEFAIFVIVMIVVSLVGKAKQQASKAGGGPIQSTQYQQPAQWLPSYGPAQGHRPPQHNLPKSKQDTDARVRELMAAGSEVAAIRLLCDEQDLGILEAQEHARSLATATGQAPATPQPATPRPAPAASRQDDEPETRYVGSAAFAESIFDLGREDDTWASGWVDTAEPDDRSDIDELWQTVRNPPRPGSTPPS